MTRTVNTLFWTLVSILALRLGLSALLPMADTTEPRYAEIARVMATSGDWITPWFDAGVPFWGKPPFSFWCQALSFKLFGFNEFAARLPSWLANVGIVYLVYATRVALHPEKASDSAQRAGLWAALIYATMALGFVSAGTVMTDSFLALGTTMILTGLIVRLQGGSERWAWLFFLGLVIGLLAKGPVAVVLTGAPVFFWALLSRQWQRLWQCLPWVRGTLAMLVLVLPWYILAELKTPGFLDYFIVGEHIKRFLVSNWQGDLYGDAHDFPRGTIWLYLVLASFPWGLIALGGWIKKQWRRNGDQNQWLTRTRGVTGLVIGAALTPALFFTLAGNILWTYVLPGLPFLAVLVSNLLPREPARTGRNLVVASILAAPVLCAGATLWLSLHPDDLKTEKAMIERSRARSDLANHPLVYLDKPPFSARFYGEGEVQSIPSETLNEKLASGTLERPMLLAVPKNDRTLRQKLDARAEQIDHNRRYILFRIPVNSKSTVTTQSSKGADNA
ncbi:ArnT family glycosyltransferase [Marinobacter koreensis]|uniref:ArnT family glycosyltransferase n=1 Tax=Marinobacter koreensis TaxID=335974 RepID=A0ABW0RSY0_9GAMM|nr:glycosyltransferase family 39 protein [Marinobacter koreensis]MCK7548828.1 glycosyltransferase family 39 protein [Marinobacter koreensis]